jgi:MoxR-like ATPase
MISDTRIRSAFSSIEEVQRRLEQQDYVCSVRLATTVFLADKMGKPILVEGPAGVGKTELAKALAAALGRELIRLQCYEGLDEAKALYEWEYAKQLLYTQILRDKIGEALEGCSTLTEAVRRIAEQDDVFFSQEFLVPRPLLRAVVAEEPIVLLIDEVDKTDPEFEAFLLELLSDFQVSVPELGTLRARWVPHVILTSNNAREMTETLKRRCLYLYLDYPDPELEREIVHRKVPGISGRLAEQVVSFVQRIRTLEMKKRPSIGETLDWARALVLLNAQHLDPPLLRETLNVLLKHEQDIARVEEEIKGLGGG